MTTTNVFPKKSIVYDYSSSDSDSENVTDSDTQSDTSSSSQSESSTEYDSETSVERKKQRQTDADIDRRKRWRRKYQEMRSARENLKFNKAASYSSFLRKMDNSSVYNSSDVEELLERKMRTTNIRKDEVISFIDDNETQESDVFQNLENDIPSVSSTEPEVQIHVTTNNKTISQKPKVRNCPSFCIIF